MKLGELKKSLNKFSRDLDDSEVIFTFVVEGRQNYDLLAFVGYSNVKESPVIILGASEVATDLMLKNSLRFEDGSTPQDRGIDISE